MKQSVVYVTRFVPEYRRPILEKLNERLHGQLIVCAGSPYDKSFKDLSSGSKPEYRYVHLNNRWIGGQRALIQNVRPVFACNPSVLLAEESPRTISLPWLLTLARRKKIGTLLWGHFSSNHRTFSGNGLLNRYRIALARRVDGCVCYTDEIAELIRPYVAAEHCFTARNTLDTETLFHLHQRFAAEGKKRTRTRLGLPENASIVVFIGRLIAGKRPDVLLDLHEAMNTTGAAALIVIGEGPERAALQTRIRDQNLKNVFLPGALPRLEDSAPWIYAADIMVCPGYVGLNVNHAFCLGIPVVTCTSPNPDIRYHSPEIAYLKTGLNGMQARYGDLTSLVEATQTVLKNQETFSKNAQQYARTYLRIEHMVDGLVQAVEYAGEATKAKWVKSPFQDQD